MSARQPLDLDAPLTDAEVRELHQHLPDFVRVGDEGELIPLRTRREIFHLQLRFPSLDPRNAAPRVNTGDQATDLLAARYPSMFRGPK
jgi:hypothetical protein